MLIGRGGGIIRKDLQRCGNRTRFGLEPSPRVYVPRLPDEFGRLKCLSERLSSGGRSPAALYPETCFHLPECYNNSGEDT